MSEVLIAALLSAICFTESKHDANAINFHDGGSPSYGYCQVKLSTARWMGFKGHVSELWLNKETNQKYADKYLRYQLKRYHGNVKRALAAYNAGSAGKEIKNTKYVTKVLLAFKEGR